MENTNLYMVLLGCRPPGRFTEQHDIFFGIGNSLRDLLPEIKSFWPEARGRIHIDSWRKITMVDGYRISVIPKSAGQDQKQLYFINLGGYKENDMEEFHYKVLTVASDIKLAVKLAKQTAFFKHYSLPGAVSHVDDKFGIDVDDIFNVSDILHASYKQRFSLQITKTSETEEDILHIGYLRLDKIK